MVVAAALPFHPYHSLHPIVASRLHIIVINAFTICLYTILQLTPHYVHDDICSGVLRLSIVRHHYLREQSRHDVGKLV
jgi:hypothetical protein